MSAAAHIRRMRPEDAAALIALRRQALERAGFRAWGKEPRALHWNGRSVDELHLVLELGERRRLTARV